MYSKTTFKKAIKTIDLEEVAQNLNRYHSILKDVRNDFWRTTIYAVGKESVKVDYYKGEFKGITYFI